VKIGPMVSVTLAVPKDWLTIAESLATLSNVEMVEADSVGIIAAEVRITRADMLRHALEYGLAHYAGIVNGVGGIDVDELSRRAAERKKAAGL